MLLIINVCFILLHLEKSPRVFFHNFSFSRRVPESWHGRFFLASSFNLWVSFLLKGLGDAKQE
jgi:hypothetical protein